MFSGNKEEKIRHEFSRLKNICYLDHAGATLYSERQLEAVTKDLCNNVYGNPHSLSLSSRYTTDVIDQVRYRILQHFNTDSQEYSVVFTSGATAALKMVAECFDWTEEYFEGTENPHGVDLEGEESGVSRNGTGNITTIKNGEITRKREEKKEMKRPCYTGEAGDFVYLQDNHTSVLGMRVPAAEKCGSVYCLSDSDVFDAFSTNCIEDESTHGAAHAGNSLFVYPAQSNFSGVKYPLSWIAQAQDGRLETVLCSRSAGNKRENKCSRWFCMLDAASHVTTQTIDLSRVKPDFLCISFYKMFGYPTGLGALLVRNTSANVLRKKYFGGGTVLIALSCENFHVPRPLLSDRFEDGTIPFLSIASVQHGFDTLKRLVGDMQSVAEHTFALAQRLFHSLLTLHHSNGRPAAVLYGDTDYRDQSTQGGIVNFNLLRANKEYVGFVEILNMANLHGIQLRTGCFCNPGACQKHLGHSSQDVKHHFQAGHVCGDDRDLVDGQPTGSVRVSFGYMSSKEDVDKLLSLVINCFVEKPAINKIPEWWASHVEMYRSKFFKEPECTDVEQVGTNNNGIHSQRKNGSDSCSDVPSLSLALCMDVTAGDQERPKDAGNSTLAEHMTLTHIFLYPVKSCAALAVSSWTIGPRGLIYDREWMVVTASGVCLTQKQETKLCLIQPFIDLERNRLRLNYPGMPPADVPLDAGAEGGVCHSKVCRDRVQAADCGEEVACWLSQALLRDGVRLIRQLDGPSRVASRGGGDQKPSLSLSNQAQFLLLNQRTIDWLGEKIEDDSDCTKESLLHRFRCNLVVYGGMPFEEHDWEKVRIGDAILKSAGLCTRCQMICIDQSTGEKTVEPLRTLAACLQGKMRFGVYFTQQCSENPSYNIQVGAKVQVL
ncbi:molybdenum cofactor sulfurase 3 [Bacillus rossius redtenbacheri]|uniref:molybdenum cofactor sulfurase 3 n=1 Tax=Bacillus rossius redtenbacheri TaxID=93214 RepID=UPI002FDCBB6B